MRRKVLDLAAAWILALGILPSYTALSSKLGEMFPALYRWTGPFNPLKAFWLVLVGQIFLHRRRISKNTWIALFAILTIGTLSTLVAGNLCDYGFPPLFMREWLVISIGAIAATSFLLLPYPLQGKVILFWAIAIYGSCLLDAVYPNATDWLFEAVFDPQTRHLDLIEVGRRVLNGVFGRQSLAKLLAWMPWLMLSWIFTQPHRKTSRIWITLLAVAGSGIILGTSQRGPFLGALAGWLAFGLHQFIQLHRKKMLLGAVGAVLSILAITVVLIPKDIWQPRIKSILAMKQDTQVGLNADVNRDFRLKMAQFSLDVIKQNPWGKPCISMNDFLNAGITHLNHSHNLLIQQFRDRGWIWGLVHLLLWLWAWVASFRIKTESGSAIFAGVTTTLALGMFDHPWFVLNHAMILWLFIGLALAEGLAHSRIAKAA